MLDSRRCLFIFLSCLLPVSLILVGCIPFSTTSPTNSMVLKVAQNSTALSYFPLYVAEQEHFFTTEGVICDPSPIPILGNGTKTAAAIEAGSVEVGIGTITDAFTLSRINAHIRIIGGFSNAFLIDIIVSKRFAQQTRLSEKNPLSDKVKALLGKKIGISAPGSATDALITYLFRQQGFDDQKEVTKVNLGNVTPQAALAALSSGRVDAVSFPAPAGQEAQARGIGDIFISPALGDVPEMRGMVYGVVYTKDQIINAKPKAIQALIRVLAQTEHFMQHYPDQTKALLRAYLQLDQQTTNTLTAVLASVPQTPLIDQTGYDIANQFHVKAGLIAIALSYTDLVATDTIKKALTTPSPAPTRQKAKETPT